MRRAALLLFAAALPSFAAEQWLRLTSPNFEIYTSAGEKKGRAAILHFEQVRSFFLKASPVKNLSDVPVRLVQFGSDAEFRKYTVNAAAVAFYLPGTGRDYIVMDDEKVHDFGVATHEYFHLIVRHSGMRLPVWLNEGWADVYSSLRPMKSEAAVGDLLPDRMKELTGERWLDYETLTSVTSRSPIYNEAERAGIFYAESWALTHMLYLSPEYADNFGKFVTALNQGSSTDDALRLGWGKTGAQIMADLESYLKRKKLTGRVYETRLTRDEQEPVVEPVSSFDARIGLAELLVATHKTAEAREAFKQLEQEKPDSAGVARALGYFALQDQDFAGAIQYFEKAFERGEMDARMCFTLALMEQERHQKPELVVAALERAVNSRPGYTDAELVLGVEKIARRDFVNGIGILTAIPTVRPERAAGVYCNLTYAHIETGDLAAAQADLATCRKYANSDAETARVGQMARLMEARTKPAAGSHPGEKRRVVAGSFQSLECPAAGAGPARLKIVSGNQALVFDFPDPAAVELMRKPGADQVATFQLRCGSLPALPVSVEYAPPLESSSSTGIARRVEY